MLGSAICRRLEKEDVEVLTITHEALDLTRQLDVENWIKLNKPDVIIIAAARVGGIYANSNYPAEFIYQNLAIEQNLINAAHLFGVERVVMLGSSCCYPKFAPQPIIESSLLDGKPEPTNEWYTVAKIAGIKLCESYRKQYGSDFISIVPANLFGPGDNFDLLNSHVIPALINRIHDAKIKGIPSVLIWGTGEAKREFMYVDDASDAIIFLLQNYSDEKVINIGTGEEITIKNLSHMIAKTLNYNGSLLFDRDKPDGAPRKVLDVSKLNSFGWYHKTNFEIALKQTYKWFLENKN